MAYTNFVKLKKAFNRCGSEDDSYSQISELSDDVCDASIEILSAFSHWAKTHLSTCKNNQVHIERMETKWFNIYKRALRCGEDQSVGESLKLRRETNPNKHRYCEIIDGWTSECSPEQCYAYVHEGTDEFWDYETYSYMYEDFSCEFTISSVCDPNFVDRYGDGCDWYAENSGKHCEYHTTSALLYYGVLTAEGFKTALNCPACGCGENGPINLHDRDDSRNLTGDYKKTRKNETNQNF